ncbi:tape measure protein [Achromobacter sp. GG226]|uniref:tape measure protein n=1 Tax=Verticiella alkaliphila TaxID=2779529 RepID=UPI001C0DBDDD|nr:tape measure protein [Verticiella sp. GG226]
MSALRSYADGWSDMQSRVGAAIGDMDAAADAMGRVVDIANASYSPLQQTVAVYARNVATFADLGRSAAQAADFTEAMNNALVTTATRGQDADVVVNSLSRALATGGLNAMDFDTIVSRSPRVLKAMADQMGVNTSELRAMAAAGLVTSDVIADGLVGSLERLRAEAALMPATMADAFTRVNTNLNEFIGRIDKATGASSAVAGVILGFADGIRIAGDYLIRFGQLAAPAFQAVGAGLSMVMEYADIAVAAVAGFAAPALIGGVGLLSAALATGLVGAIKAVTAAMLANPIGALVGILAAAGYAAYKFRDTIQEAIGVDVVDIAKRAANYVIGSFVAAYEDIKFVWNNFGDMMGAAVVGGVNLAIRAINGLLDAAFSGVNSLVAAIRNIPGLGDIGDIGQGLRLSELANPANDRLAGAVRERNKAIEQALSQDYLGKLSTAMSGAARSADAAAAGLSKMGKAGATTPAALSGSTKAVTAQADALGEFIAQVEAADSAWRHHIRTIEDQVTATNAQRMALEEQAQAYGMTESQLMRLRAAQTMDAITRLESARASALLTDASGNLAARYDVEIDRLRELYESRQMLAGVMEKGEARQAYQAFSDEAQRYNEQIGQSLTDALLRGFESGEGFGKNFINTMENLFNTLVLRPIIQPVAQGAANIVTNALGMGGQGGSGGVSAGGLLNAGSSLWSAFSGGLTSTMASGVAAIGNAIGSSAVTTFASGMAGVMGPAAPGMAGIMSAGSMVGAALPWIGAGLAAISLLSGQFKGETRSGAQYGLALDGELYNPRRGTTVASANGVQFLEGPSGGGASSAVQSAIQQTVDAINGVFSTVGADVALSAFWAGYEGSEKGRGGVGAGGSLSSGASFGETGVGDNYRGTLFDPLRATSLTAEEALNLLPAQLAQASLQAWQSAADQMPEALARMLRGVDLAGLGDEALLGLRDQFVAVVAQADMLRAAMGELPFTPVVAQTFAFAAALADAAGGAENAANLLAGYYSNYYTEAERTAHLTEQLTGRFAELGLALPQTRDEMRGLVEANLALGEAGAKTAAELLAMQEPLAQILAAQEQAAQAMQAIMQERLGLEGQLLQLMGDTAELRRRELERLDPSNRALQERIWALQAEQEAATAVATAIEAATRAAEEMVEATWQLAVSAVQDAMSAVTKAVQAERDAAQTTHNTAMSRMQEQLQTAQRAASELSSVYNSLSGALRSMRLESDAFEQMRRAEAQAQISAALAIARAGGSLRNLDLGDALSAVQQNSTSMFASYEEYALDWARTANEVGALQEIAGKQLSSEERAVTALERQIELAGRQHEAEMARLQAIVDQAQAQVDAALGIDTSVMTVQQAVMALAQSIGKLASTPQPPAPTPQTSGSVVDGWYRNILGRPADSGGAAYWESEIKRIGAAKALEDFLYSARGIGELASFAVGTNYVPNDMVAQIHQGERIIPAADNARLMEMVQQGSNREEMRALRAEIVELRRTVAAGNADNRRLVDMFDQVSAGGNAIVTESARDINEMA